MQLVSVLVEILQAPVPPSQILPGCVPCHIFSLLHVPPQRFIPEPWHGGRVDVNGFLGFIRRRIDAIDAPDLFGLRNPKLGALHVNLFAIVVLGDGEALGARGIVVSAFARLDVLREHAHPQIGCAHAPLLGLRQRAPADRAQHARAHHAVVRVGVDVKLAVLLAVQQRLARRGAEAHLFQLVIGRCVGVLAGLLQHIGHGLEGGEARRLGDHVVIAELCALHQATGFVQAERAVTHEQRLRAAHALLLEHEGGERRHHGALAVADDVDGLVRAVTADGGDQVGQSAGGVDVVGARRALGQVAVGDGIEALEVQREALVLAEHVPQSRGTVLEGAAAPGVVLIQCHRVVAQLGVVRVAVVVLARASIVTFAGLEAPIEADHRGLGEQIVAVGGVLYAVEVGACTLEGAVGTVGVAWVVIRD